MPGRSRYTCGACGTIQDVLTTVKASGKSGPVAAYAVQGHCPECAREKQPYRGRFFAPLDDSRQLDAAALEWSRRRDGDLQRWWPRSALPRGYMTHTLNGGIPNHGFTHWWTLFNPRQLLVHSQLLRAIVHAGGAGIPWDAREAVLASFQQHLRNQSMLSFWHLSHDKLAPGLSNANYHPKSTVVEVGVFPPVGYGPWSRTAPTGLKALAWKDDPWELVSKAELARRAPAVASTLPGRSAKARTGDPVRAPAGLWIGSATDLDADDGAFDLVVTDPPFGDLLHYSELSDFFYVWLRLALKDRYPAAFEPEYTPKTLEVVTNRARNPDDADTYYRRLLTDAWREAHRVLKPGGMLVFTFHHSADAPWVAVLESLFDAGFELAATYPIRGDETKGKGEFGSRTIEFDIIHVCRKRREPPRRISWARLRRQILREVRRLTGLLELHRRAGLDEADLQVIRRGKAIEFFSRHHGRVYLDEHNAMPLTQALIGINQVLVEDHLAADQLPPASAEPLTRLFLRLFSGSLPRLLSGDAALARDVLQKHLRGTGADASDFVRRGWCTLDRKARRYVARAPREHARAWQSRPLARMFGDLDQALFLIGACADGSGIAVGELLQRRELRPHAALGELLAWFESKVEDNATRVAITRARALLRAHARPPPPQGTSALS